MKFQRTYKIMIEISETETLIIEPPLSISFNVVRDNLASANTLDLKIINLSPYVRSRIFQDWYSLNIYKRIILYAGYEEYKELPMIFFGNITRAFSERQGTEVITSIYARDAGFDISNSQSNQTFAQGTPIKEILEKLMQDFDHVQKGNITEIEGYKKRGAVYLGNTFDIINRESGEIASIDLEKINLIRNNEAVIGDVPLINSDSGLLGTPKRENACLGVDMIFEPRIKINQVIDIESGIQPEFNGQYKVIGCTHSGVISGAESGSCITTLQLLIGAELFGRNTNQEINNVGKFKILDVRSSDIDYVYNYLKSKGEPPDLKITPSIKWADMLIYYKRMGELPNKKILYNLTSIAKVLQNIKNRYFKGKNIKIESGWRSSQYNLRKGFAPNSFHVRGLAVDFNVYGMSPRAVQNILKDYNGGLEYTNTHTHIDLGPKRRFNKYGGA